MIVSAAGVWLAAVGLHHAKLTLPAVGHFSKRSKPLGDVGAAASAVMIESLVKTPVAATVTVVPQARDAIAAVVIFAVPLATVAITVPTLLEILPGTVQVVLLA